MSGRKRPILLIAEDDDQERERLASLARELGFRVIQAPDGEQALAQLDRVVPDLVVTDYYMPRLDGLGLVKRLRTHPRGARIPVMVITSDDMRRTKIRLLQAGADDFLVKPVDHLEFSARLSSLARRSRLLSQLGCALASQDQARSRLEHKLARPSDLVVALAAAMERGADQAAIRSHLRRVSELSGILAEAYGCDKSFVALMRQLSVLHDVGMVGIAERIMQAAGPLSEEDYEEVKTHTLVGEELLRDASLPSIACNIALFHHKRWDGTGYPHGLRGADIPLEARILAVVDVFDAILVGRRDGGPRSLELAVSELGRCLGTQLDPDLTGSLLAIGEPVERVVRQWPREYRDAEAWS